MICRLFLLIFIIAIAPQTGLARVYLGLEVFLKKYTHIVKNKRVGLITNQTGVNGLLLSAADLLKNDPRVNLTALFAPEHGIRGNFVAGANFKSKKDAKTGLPIYSLYGGKDHRPPAGSLNKVDVLMYCMQDVGARPYTYIWHLAECMSAAAAAKKTIIVLDTPNPLGCLQTDGPGVDKSLRSFIGLYSIPYTYGLTVGELARYLNKEEKINCKLFIVPMANYSRVMSWKETGLSWVPTSPNIPSAESAYCFPITGPIGTLSCVNIGVGCTLPFQIIVTPRLDADHMAYSLNKLNFAGIRFRPIHYKPSCGLFANKQTHGVQLHIRNTTTLKPTTISIAILKYLQKHCPEFKWQKGRGIKNEGFNKAMGTAAVKRMLQQGKSWQNIANTWSAFNKNFKRRTAKYRIYK